MLIIGLTGGTGAGKGMVGIYFTELGVPSIDTDLVSRQVCRKGEVCLSELVSYFGSEILLSTGELDRKKLASVAFADKKKLEKLNSITHKHIIEKVFQYIEEYKKEGKNAVIIDAPLLFESGLDSKCDCNVAVISNTEKRIARIIERDGITREKALERINNQKSDVFFINHCNYVLFNDGDLDELKKNVGYLYDRIKK